MAVVEATPIAQSTSHVLSIRTIRAADQPKPKPKSPDYFIRKIAQKKGKPNLYVDNFDLTRAGFHPGIRFNVELLREGIALRISTDGANKVSRKVSGDKEVPVVDIASQSTLQLFNGLDRVRVILRDNEVFILPLASELAKRERLGRLTKKLLNDEPIQIGSVCHGGGLLSHAVHKGLAEAGVSTNLAFANEIHEPYLMQAHEKNPAHTKDGDNRTMLLSAPLQELVQDRWLMDQLPSLEVLEMGLACSGASVAGKAKNKNKLMEDHPHVGHLIFAAITVILKTQPGVVLLENVTQYANTGSKAILANQLADMGYDTHEITLSGSEFGTIQDRTRWYFVATTAGLDFDLENLLPKEVSLNRIKDVLDPSIGPDNSRWKSFDYLKAKEERDIAAGKNFRMAIFDENDTSVNTFTKGYAKVRSTDPKLRHPTDPNLMRLFTPLEAARMSGVDPVLLEGVSETMAHEMLGQGVINDPPQAIAKRVGDSFNTLKASASGIGRAEIIRMQRERIQQFNVARELLLNGPKTGKAEENQSGNDTTEQDNQQLDLGM